MLDSHTPIRPPPEGQQPVAIPRAPAIITTDPPDRRPIRQPARRRWLWLVVLVAVIAGTAYRFRPAAAAAAPAGRGARSGSGGGTIPVVTARARQGDIGVYFSGVGAVTPFATVTVRSRVDGQLLRMHFHEGQTVHQGDLLAEIDDGLYRAALAQAEGQLTRDQATLENARVDQGRYEQLLPQKAIPAQQVATQEATVHQQEGVVQVDQGQLQTARVNLAYTRINAPVTGRVGLRLVDPGNIVHASDSTGLVVITQMDPISVIFTIPEDQLQAVRARQASGDKLGVDAYDRTAQTLLAHGTLTTLDNQIDPSTGTLRLRATFDNPKGLLYPNQFVNARLLVQEKQGVVLAPTAAVQRNAQSTYAYVVKPDSTVTVRQVVVGTTEGDDAEIVSGLTNGDTVVMTGVDKLQEGSRVTAQGASTPSAVPGR